MFTKVGSAMMEKTSYAHWLGLLGAGTGYNRSFLLTSKEKAALRDKHSLSDDSNLALRNAGRGTLGALGGGMIGAGLGGAAAAALALSGKLRTLEGVDAVGRIGAVGGAGLGTYLATNKYSKGAAKEAV